MKATHDTRKIPLLMSHIFDGLIGVINARIEEDVDVNSANGDDPVEEKTQRP